MKKLLVIMLACFLLIGQTLLSGGADYNDLAKRTLLYDGGSIYFNALSGVNIYNYTNKPFAEQIPAEREIAAKIYSLHLAVEEEMNAVLNEQDTNPEELPITLEVIAIGEDVTYIYSLKEGEDPVVYLIESNIRTVSEAEGISPDLRVYERSYYYDDHFHPDSGIFGITGVTRTSDTKDITGCPGPCTITPGHDFTDGLGVRLPITQSGTVLSFSVVTSADDTITPIDGKNQLLAGGACFLYAGFNSIVPGVGEITTDMGLIYQKMYETDTYAWKPLYLVKCGKSEIAGPANVEGQAFSRNGYIPGETVEIEIRIDPVANNADMDRVSLRTAGYAFHETSSGAGGITYLVQLCYSDFSIIKTPHDWRLLATSVIPNNNGSGIACTFASGDFQNILLDGAPPVFNQTVCNYGYAESRGGGDYFLQVCKGLGNIKPRELLQ